MAKSTKNKTPVNDVDVDVDIYDNSSIMSFAPLTQTAKDWVSENLQLESWQWLSGMFNLESRYADSIIQGMINDGLEVNLNQPDTIDCYDTIRN
jgi:hypothetical protein